MAGGFFTRKFGMSATGFNSTTEIDSFVEKKTKRPLPVKYAHQGISSCRGSVFPLSNKDAGKEFDKRINRR